MARRTAEKGTGAKAGYVYREFMVGGRMSYIDRDNHLVVHGWMITDLKLKGIRLILYACIYGFTQTYGQAFMGSIGYLMDWTGSSKQGVTNALNSLIADGLIEKSVAENDKRKVKFRSTKCTENQSTNLTDLDKNQSRKLTEFGQVSLPTRSTNLTEITNPPYNPPNKVLKQRESIEENKKESKKEQTRSFDALIAKYSEGDSETETLLQYWLKNRMAKRAAMTDHAIELNLMKMRELAKQSGMELNCYLEEIVRLGWTAFFVIGNYKKPQTSKGVLDDMQELYDYYAQENGNASN